MSALARLGAVQAVVIRIRAGHRGIGAGDWNDAAEEEARKGKTACYDRQNKEERFRVAGEQPRAQTREEECAEPESGEWQCSGRASMLWPVQCRCKLRQRRNSPQRNSHSPIFSAPPNAQQLPTPVSVEKKHNAGTPMNPRPLTIAVTHHQHHDSFPTTMTSIPKYMG
jgi:hypothetical protein